MTKREQVVGLILAHYPQYSECCYSDGDACEAGDHFPVAMTGSDAVRAASSCSADEALAERTDETKRLFAEHLADVILGAL